MLPNRYFCLAPPVALPGIFLLSASGGPVTTLWPLWRTYAWAPMCTPVIYLIVNLAYPQPTTRILQVVLLNAFVILQVKSGRERGICGVSLSVLGKPSCWGTIVQFCILLCQVAALAVLRILDRERNSRVFYSALKEIAAEQQRCERVLSLLLPPTLVTSVGGVVVAAAAGEADHADLARHPDGWSATVSPSDTIDSGVIDVVSIGAERFAEAFESASVLFAEGKRGTRVWRFPRPLSA